MLIAQGLNFMRTVRNLLSKRHGFTWIRSITQLQLYGTI